MQIPVKLIVINRTDKINVGIKQNIKYTKIYVMYRSRITITHMRWQHFSDNLNAACVNGTSIQNTIYIVGEHGIGKYT